MAKQKVRTYLVGVSLVLLSLGCQQRNESLPELSSGTLDLRNFAMDRHGPLTLRGDGLFYWNEFISPRKFRRKKPPKGGVALPVTNSWVDLAEHNLPSRGYGTYYFAVRKNKKEPLRLWLPAIGTAFKLYIDENLRAQGGTPGGQLQHQPGLARPMVELPEGRDFHRIVFHISSYEVTRGGFWDPMVLGTPGQILKRRDFTQLVDHTIFGSMFVGFFYFLVVFLSWRRDKEILYFSCFAFLVALRSLLTGNRYLHEALAPAGFDVLRQIEYIAFYLSVPFFLLFIKKLLSSSHRWSKYVDYTVTLVSLLFIGPVLLTDPFIYTHHLFFFQAFSGLVAVYLLVLIFSAMLRKRIEGYITFFGVSVVLFGLYNDISFVNTGSAPIMYQIAPFCVMVFILPFAVFIGVRLTSHSKNNFKLSVQLTRQNLSLSRFVPTKFLEIFGSRSIDDVVLGTSKTVEGTVFFADIRGYTAISERLSGEQVMQFLNGYYSRTVPILDRNHCVVDKYIGDSIMGLCLDGPDYACRAALAIQKELVRYNNELTESGFPPIRVGFGIHYGTIVAGTIGTSERMDTTVVSDAVNLAARLERLCSKFNADILVSMELFFALTDQSSYNYRFVDRIQLRNREEPAMVVEILDSKPPEQLKLYVETKELYERAFFAFAEGQFSEAGAVFKKVLAVNPKDKVSAYYLAECNKSQTRQANIRT